MTEGRLGDRELYARLREAAKKIMADTGRGLTRPTIPVSPAAYPAWVAWLAENYPEAEAIPVGGVASDYR